MKIHAKIFVKQSTKSLLIGMNNKYAEKQEIL